MTTFVVIGVVGLLLLVLTLLLGDVIEGVVDGFGPDWLSGTAIAAFLAAVGFGGALALQLGASEGVATASGIGAGLAAGVLAGLLTRSLAREGGADSTPSAGALVGQVGTVVSAVPADGYGTVALTVAGHPTRLNARAGTPLAAGSQVRVTTVLSSSAVQVEPVTPA